MSDFLLFLASFLAGFIDAIAGGGGLITVPALLIAYPNLPVATLLGTNKTCSICGTSMAVWIYSRQVKLPWKLLSPALFAAFVLSYLGAQTASLLPQEIMRRVVLALLILIAIYTFSKKDFGLNHLRKLSTMKELLLTTAAGAALGFYDGFFGPGTGSFLIFVFTALVGFDFLHASASAKLINWCTNLAAVIFFWSTGQVMISTGLMLGLANVLGAILGSRLAILKGSAFVRIFFLLIVLAIICRLAYDILVS